MEYMAEYGEVGMDWDPDYKVSCWAQRNGGLHFIVRDAGGRKVKKGGAQVNGDACGLGSLWADLYRRGVRTVGEAETFPCAISGLYSLSEVRAKVVASRDGVHDITVYAF